LIIAVTGSSPTRFSSCYLTRDRSCVGSPARLTHPLRRCYCRPIYVQLKEIPINGLRTLVLITVGIIAISAVAACGGDDGGGGTGSSDDLLPLQLPFEYTVGERTLEVPTSGGTVHVSIGPFGAHFQPLSGDPIGDAKSNLIGWFAGDSTELDPRSYSHLHRSGRCKSHAPASEQWAGRNLLRQRASLGN